MASILSKNLNEILSPVQDEINILDRRLIDEISPSSRALCGILQDIFRAGGKRLRPALSFLIAKSLQPKSTISENIYLIAEISELIHTASLVHDDIIDNSLLRRGKPTTNSKWDNAITVISGDFMFARAAVNLGKLGINSITSLFAQVLADLCDGEIRQVEKKFSTDIDWDYYYSKSHKKTASLIEAACTAPALAYSASKQEIEAAAIYGRNLGLAFQIIDDILDFTSGSDTLGKPALSDLKDGQVTIPVLFALEHPAYTATLKNKINLLAENNDDPELIPEILQIIKDSKSIELSTSKAQELINTAIKALDCFTNSDAKQSLIELASFVITRNN